MSDLNRVFMDTIGEKKSSNPSRSSKAMRFTLDLFEPNKKDFPQFNFSTLTRIEKEKKKKLNQNGVANQFEENDDIEAARIAAELERKYGNAYTGSGIGVRSMHNNYDKGSGYDENDGFIDNSEAYDELMPDEVDTDRGGFYVNSGPLIFKKAENFERPDDAIRMPKAKKRVFSSSSSSEADDDDDDEHDVDGNKERPSAHKLKNGHTGKKMKISNDKEKALPNKEIKKNEQAKGKDKNDRAGSDSGKENAQKSVKTTTVKDMLRVKRDTMRNMTINGDKSDKTTTEASSSECASESSEDDVATSAAIAAAATTSKSSIDIDAKPPNTIPNCENDDKDIDDANVSTRNDDGNTKIDVKLPENLPTPLLELIEKIKEATKQTTSKSNFFNADNLKTIVDIDNVARQLKESAVRLQIFSHLEKYLPYTKQTILQRIKKYKIEQEDAKVIYIQQKLEETVKSVMPDVIEAHKVRTQQLKVDYDKRKASGEKIETQFRSPRRKFPWTDEIRDLVSKLIKIKEQSYMVIKPRNKTRDEFIDVYFDEKIIPMWPQGWMRKDELRSECDKSKGKKSKEQRKSLPIASSSSIQNANLSSTSPIMKMDRNSNQVIDQSMVASGNNSADVSSSMLSIPPSSLRTILSTSSSSTTTVSKTETHHLPLPNFLSNSLTITPVDASDGMPKPPAKFQNKVTITNIDPGAPASALQRSPPKVNATSNNDHTANHSQYESPSKRATDHSISNIMASPPSDTSRPISVDSTPMTSPVHLSSSLLHLDKNAQSIVTLAKAAAELNRITTTTASTEELPITINNVQSLATTSDLQKQQQRSKSIDLLESSDSDGVEFIGTSEHLIGSPSERYHDREKYVNVNKTKYKANDAAKTLSGNKSQTLNDNIDGVDIQKTLQQLKELEDLNRH